VNYEHFVVGDYLFAPKVYNEFSNGITGNGFSYAVRGAFEFPLFGLPWMIAGDYRQYTYQHNSTYGVAGDCTPGGPSDQSCVTVVGGGGAVYVPGFTAKDQDIDAVFGLKVVDPRIYIGVGYLWRQENYGYPIENGVGFGLEKLPDLDQPFSVYGSIYYYPSIQGPTPGSYLPGGQLSYRDLKYQGGITYTIGSFSGFGVFLDANYLGDQLRVKSLAPSQANHSAAAVGIGLKF
jgi:hypothetical protein